MTTPLPKPACPKSGTRQPSDLFTEAQLRQYGEAEYRRGLADAAELCDGQAQGWKETPFGAGCGGYIASANCAFYIRKLGEKS